MPFTLRTTSSPAELKLAFDGDFDVANPMDHIHGAILNLCNPGFNHPGTRAGMVNLVINMTVLHTQYSNIAQFLYNAMADGAINFRPDTPIHANDEGRYPGGTLTDRAEHRPRHFEFGAVGGGMRIVYDNDTEELYISAHYSFPGRLIAAAGSPQEDWLMTVKARLTGECCIMSDHSTGKTRAQRKEVERLRELAVKSRAGGLSQTERDCTNNANRLEGSLQLRATRNRAFAAWLREPRAYMDAAARHELYGV